jgi:hypothetical protein
MLEKSCATDLVESTDVVMRAVDENKAADFILPDFDKDFDKVPSS